MERPQNPNFNPNEPANFDPFQVEHKGKDLREFAEMVTGNYNGFVQTLDDVFALFEEEQLLLTEGPGGLRLGSDRQPSLIVNCPVPITIRE